ncbi:MAG TPA: hypothetical protein DCY88_06965 [Cyanobacteria bacterium UBA11372]|nr:hypothetical protein [Cyanobacteria bacterium UBA11372]
MTMITISHNLVSLIYKGLSGLQSSTGNAVWGQLQRGFESLPLRSQDIRKSLLRRHFNKITPSPNPIFSSRKPDGLGNFSCFLAAFDYGLTMMVTEKKDTSLAHSVSSFQGLICN